jgi:capsular polysaccharide biosynthesis protein
MELRLYLDILRRHWRILLAVPALIMLISGATALARPARYGVQMRLLVTRDMSNASVVGRTAAGEDTTAQDLPAILKSTAFRRDLAQALTQRGQPVDAAALIDMIGATTSEHEVVAIVGSTLPEQALAVAKALIEVLQSNGLRYWGDPNATSAHPGLHVGVLDPPEQAVRLNGPRSVVLEVGLRTSAGLGAAIGLVFALDFVERRKAQ